MPKPTGGSSARKGHPRTPRWVASEQAAYHDVDRTVNDAVTGHLSARELTVRVLAYGEACATRAGELSRHAAEVRARRRLAKAGVSD